LVLSLCMTAASLATIGRSKSGARDLIKRSEQAARLLPLQGVLFLILAKKGRSVFAGMRRFCGEYNENTGAAFAHPPRAHTRKHSSPLQSHDINGKPSEYASSHRKSSARLQHKEDTYYLQWRFLQI